MYICMQTYMYVCMHVCVCIYIYIVYPDNTEVVVAEVVIA